MATGTSRDMLETDAQPIDQRHLPTINSSEPRHNYRGPNRISNAEVYSNDPRYPRNAAQDPVEPFELIHFVFVFAKEDFSKFEEFIIWFKRIVGAVANGETVKIETHDSEEFPPAHDDNVHDICERAIFILPFLTKHYCSDKKLQFFTSEGIGKTRLDPTTPTGHCSKIVKDQKTYCIRPVLTSNPKSGEYSIPTGLTMIRGIDFYYKDENPGFVKKQVTSIVKDAMGKFQERRNAMTAALTGSDVFLEDFNRRFDQMYGPPPTPEMYTNSGSFPDFPEKEVTYYSNENILHDMPEAHNLQDRSAVQEQGEERAEGREGSPVTNGRLQATTENTRSGIQESQRQHFTGESNLAEANGGEDSGSLDSSERDLSLEIDNGSMSRSPKDIEKSEGSQGQHVKTKVCSTPAKPGSGSGAQKLPDDEVVSNYESYTEPVVSHVAKAAAGNTGNTRQKEMIGNPGEKGKKPKETYNIVISNCGVVQIGDGSAIQTSNLKGKRKADLGRNLSKETAWNDLSSAKPSIKGEEKTQQQRPKSLDSDNETVIQDNIPSDYSQLSPPPHTTGTMQGDRNTDDYSENLVSDPEVSNSDMDSFLDNQLNDSSLESLPPFGGGTYPQAIPLSSLPQFAFGSSSQEPSFSFSSQEPSFGSSSQEPSFSSILKKPALIPISHEPVFRLCKNTLKRYSSVDSGYQSHFSHVYKCSTSAIGGEEKYEDDVD